MRISGARTRNPLSRLRRLRPTAWQMRISGARTRNPLLSPSALAQGRHRASAGNPNFTHCPSALFAAESLAPRLRLVSTASHAYTALMAEVSLPSLTIRPQPAVAMSPLVVPRPLGASWPPTPLRALRTNSSAHPAHSAVCAPSPLFHRRWKALAMVGSKHLVAYCRPSPLFHRRWKALPDRPASPPTRPARHLGIRPQLDPRRRLQCPRRWFAVAPKTVVGSPQQRVARGPLSRKPLGPLASATPWSTEPYETSLRNLPCDCSHKPLPLERRVLTFNPKTTCGKCTLHGLIAVAPLKPERFCTAPVEQPKLSTA